MTTAVLPSHPCKMVVVVVLMLQACPLVRGQPANAPAPSDENQLSENCDLQAWDTFLKSGRDGQPINSELLDLASIGCRAEIKKLTQGYFGPASHYDRFLVGCKGICQQWDALQAQGRGASRCTCKDLDTCDQNAFFWMCKTLYECRCVSDFFFKIYLFCPYFVRLSLPPQN